MKLKVGILVSPCPSVSALFSMLFSALWLGCRELGMRKYSPRYGWNAEIMRRFLRIPVRILPSAFSPHFLRIFFHIGTRRNTRRFLRVPVRILPSAFSTHFLRIFLPYKNAEISPRSCPNTPIRIFSARRMRRSGVGASCLAWMPGSEPMLQLRQDAMPVQVASHMVADDVSKHLACYACQADRAVIFCLAGGALLKDGWDKCCLPGRWQCASLYSDWVNMAANTGAKVVESSFSMQQGTWSGPADLLGFIPVRSFLTPWILISSLSIGG